VTLRLSGAGAGYGNASVLWDVDLEIRSGEVTAVFGPNGAGKTTLLRALSGLLPLRTGTLRHDDEVVTAASTAQLARRGICHITEGRNVFDQLTVRDNLRMFAGRDAAAVDGAVEAFPVLGRRMSQVAGTMSGGEQQMLALARAYVTRPKIILLDEVSTGLAPLVLDEIFAFLGTLAATGAGLLVVEQFVERAMSIADRVCVLARGRIVSDTPAAELDRGAAFDSYLGIADPA
jgi:branched-chain amino acid transport system ATP-binding protein